jgi:tripeptide aminopeptidase
MNLRDFDDELLSEHEQLVRRLAAEAVAAHPGSSVRVEIAQPYRNMKEYLVDHPKVAEAAVEAVKRAGLEPKLTFVRGGTDGARLSQLGLPTPNLFSGQQDIHALNEWVSVADMRAAVATVVHLTQIWAEAASGAQGA